MKKQHKPIVVPTKAPRNPYAEDAKSRKAGPMKHRTEQKGGARNESRDARVEVSVDPSDLPGHDDSPGDFIRPDDFDEQGLTRPPKRR